MYPYPHFASSFQEFWNEIEILKAYTLLLPFLFLADVVPH
jgi:hypothetical protein